MTRIGLAVLATVLAAGPSPASSLQRRVERLVTQSAAARQGVIGVLVTAENGRNVVSINASHTFIPASNTKLFTAALALEVLGPNQRFTTRVERRGADLVLIGAGDANLSSRVLPYRYNSEPGPMLTAMDGLAAQVAAHGIREVGNLIGDDTAFAYEPYAPGWAVEDILNADGAPAGALLFNDDCVNVTLTPGAIDGAPVGASLDPPIALFEISNAAVTGPVDDLHSDRVPGTRLWRIWGSLPAGSPPHREQWAASDPAEFAAAALKLALERHGVRVTGGAQAVHRLPGVAFAPAAAGVTVAARESPPLIDDLRVILKTSQNLHADLLLMDVGGSRTEGLRKLDVFLRGIGIAAGQYRFYDGSGLSRMNLVTPEATVALLRFMARSPNGESWVSLLPISGVDGSLATRLTGPRVQGRIQAKTGSLNHVSSLSGYVQTIKGRRLTFAIFLNNVLSDAAAQRELIDKICEVLVN